MQRLFSHPARSKALFSLCWAGLLGLTATRGQAAPTLLSAWTFNNDSKAFGGFNGNGDGAYNANGYAGSFSSTPATYGEAYSAATLTLTSNTAMGAVFSGPNVTASFQNSYAYMGFDQNGGYVNDYGFGVGYDATGAATQNATGGSGGAGSFLVYGGGGSNVDFNLTSTGYNGLTMSFQIAAITYTGDTSLSGATYSVAAYDPAGNLLANLGGGDITGATFQTVNLALPDTLSNLPAFDLRISPTISNPSNTNHGGVEIDNVLIDGVPEPSTWTASVLLAAVLGLSVRRRWQAARVG